MAADGDLRPGEAHAPFPTRPPSPVGAFAKLFLQELFRRRFALIASLAIGLAAALVPFAVSSSKARADELRGLAAIASALLWSWFYALGAGATLFAQAASERRLGFDFRLPVGGVVLWSARLSGAIVTTLAAGLLTLLAPTLLGIDFAAASAAIDQLALYDSPWLAPGSQQPEGFVRWGPLVLVATILLANVAGLALFVRRPWSAVDLMSLVASPLLFAVLLDRLSLWNAPNTTAFLTAAGATAFGTVLLVASAFQVSVGRSEPDRAACAFSVALLTGCAGVLVAAFGFVTWSTRPALADLLAWRADVRPVGGRWVAVLARASHRESRFRFLVDAREGHGLSLGPYPRSSFWSSGVQTTADESLVAWLECAGRGASGCEVELWTALAGNLGDRTPSGLTWPAPPRAWALSPQGDRVATRQRLESARDREQGWGVPADPRAPPAPLRLVIEEIASLRVLHSIAISGHCWDGPIAFLDEFRVLVACGVGFEGDHTPSESIIEVDLRTSSTQTLRHERYVAGGAMDGVRTGSPELLRAIEKDEQQKATKIERVDRATGESRGVLLPPPGSNFGWGVSGRVLSSRWALLWLEPGRPRRLAVYAPDGKLAHEISEMNYAEIGGELADGKFVLLTFHGERLRMDGYGYGCGFGAARLDLLSGRIERLGGAFYRPIPGLVRSQTVLLRDCDGAYWWFDRESAELRELTWLDPKKPVETWFWRSTGQIESELEERWYGGPHIAY